MDVHASWGWARKIPAAAVGVALLLALPSAASASTPPQVFFDSVSGVSATQATFNGRVNDGGITAESWFRMCKLSECPTHAHPPGNAEPDPGPGEFETPRNA